jgi:AmmeMemoRadiSam system protein A
MKAFIVPHPPIMVPEIGRSHLQEIEKTVIAMKELGAMMKDEKPQSVIVISPHSPAFGDAFAVKTIPHLKGSFMQFGEPGVAFEWETDMGLASAILEASKAAGVSTVSLDEDLAERFGVDASIDHGVLAPMYYVFAGYQCPVVSLSISGLPLVDHFAFGMTIKKAIDKTQKKVVFVASGDLSHRLTKEGPAGYNPKGKEFDSQVVELFKKGDLAGLMKIDKELIEDAGECGLRSYVVMAGLMDGVKVEAEVLSYEGPFGVGYPVGIMTGTKEAPGKWEGIVKDIEDERKKSIEEECLPVQIARQAVESFVGESRPPSIPEDLPDYLKKKAGVFVSLKRGNVLRGCIGTIEPAQETIAEEIARNAISAATQDMRFEPVSAEELADMSYSVDILSESECVSDTECLDPRQYGVIVEAGGRKGLLLPDLEGVDTTDDQLAIAKRKAGIKEDKHCRISRFTVTRYR